MPILSYGDMYVNRERKNTVKEPTRIIRKVQKQRGEQHMLDILRKIPLDAVMEQFEKIFSTTAARK
ncbi:hypothetical protein ACJMK2_029552, partial [Sinanodonta woodiana]